MSTLVLVAAFALALWAVRAVTLGVVLLAALYRWSTAAMLLLLLGAR